jgi:non-specific serine/threonine protein kinase/serine/threonine-protein kinase
MSPADATLEACPACLVALGFGSSASAASETRDGESSGRPERIGRYRILDVLGQGGMGIVYLAEQSEPIRRRVALKLVKLGMDSRQVIARFESERQALALMNHPHVAKVFDAGISEDGRPYFVMEHVSGLPITDYADRHRLTVRERLELVLQTCAALQHAHQKGIIHRDVKPSNVLVALEDERPSVKVIDFGVAKATSQRLTERTVHTRLGVLIGTPEYMSPEQAGLTALDVDTRADVYSLGVVLYELLVGALPFDPRELRRAAGLEMLRIIREVEPPRPTVRISSLGDRAEEVARRRHTDVPSLARRVRGELEWITLRAMEKDPARRYAAISELAADIERHLSDLPVLAGPPSVAYRTGKFVRRHRWAVAALSVAAVGLAAFAATMAWQSARTARERDRANREAQTARQALEFLTGLFEVSNPSQARGSSITAREILDRGAGKLDSELGGEPRIRATLLLTIGRVYQSLGLYDAGESLIARALELRRELLGEDDPDTLTAADHEGSVLHAQGKLEESEAYFRRALEGRSRVLGPDHPDTISSLNNLALLLQDAGKLPESEQLEREAVERWRRVRGDDDHDTLTAMHNLALVLGRQAKHEEAERYARQVVEGFRRILGNDHPDTLASLNNLAQLLKEVDRLDEAEALYHEALLGRRRVLGHDHPDTLLSIGNLSGIYMKRGDLESALRHEREALEGYRRVVGNDHPDTLRTVNNVAYILGSQGKLDDAEPFYREALEGRRRVLGPDHPSTLTSINNMGFLLREKGRFEESGRYYREALEGRRRVLGQDHPHTLQSLNNVGRILVLQGRAEEAVAYHVEALAGYRRIRGNEHVDTLDCLVQLGRAYAAAGRFAQAEQVLVEAHTGLAQAGSDAAAQAASGLAELYERWGRPTQAVNWRARAGAVR